MNDERWQKSQPPIWFPDPIRRHCYPQIDPQGIWDAMTEIERWRWCCRSAISVMLGLARTSYLNAEPYVAKKRCQMQLLSIRRTRP